jgi:hypothetical protein
MNVIASDGLYPVRHVPARGGKLREPTAGLTATLAAKNLNVAK